MKRLTLTLLLCWGCGAPEEPATAPPVIVITDDEPSIDEGPTNVADEPDDDTAPVDACEPGLQRLALPDPVLSVSAWDAGDVIYAAWVRPDGADAEVAWATYSATDGAEVSPPQVAGRVSLEDPSFTIQQTRTSIAVDDEGAVLVAWDDVTTASIDGREEEHSQVLVSYWNAAGARLKSAQVVSGDRYEGYTVDAGSPGVLPKDGGWVVAWRDYRLNEPRVIGQQHWLHGIYDTTLDASGEIVNWDRQVQQRPGVRSFELTDRGHVFLAFGDPNGPGFGHASMESPEPRHDLAFGSVGEVAGHRTEPLLAWTSDTSDRAYVLTMREGGEPVLVSTADGIDLRLAGPRFLIDSGTPHLAWVQVDEPYQEPITSELFVAVVDGALVERGTLRLPNDAAAHTLAGRALGDGARVVVASRPASGWEIYSASVCPEPATMEERFVVVRSDQSMRISGQQSASVSVDVEAQGTVVDARVYAGDYPPSPWVMDHGGVTAEFYQTSGTVAHVGMPAEGRWTLSTRANGYSWGFDWWALLLILKD